MGTPQKNSPLPIPSLDAVADLGLNPSLLRYASATYPEQEQLLARDRVSSKTRAISEQDKPSRIPSLDGCRAVSICLVLIAHLCYTPVFQAAFNPLAHMVYLCGPFGVKVFFVISGFLITTLLLQEERKNGRISVKDFYVRRAFRIWPVAYAFILVVALLVQVGLMTLPPHNLVYASTFTMNHAMVQSWFTGHLWSLAVEEQFYLLWPLIFLFTSRRGRLLSCFLVMLLAPLSRILTYIYQPEIHLAMQESLLFMGDAIAIGCLLALLSKELEDSKVMRRIIGMRLFVIVPLLSAVMYILLKPFPRFYLAVGQSIALICIAITIWRVIHVRDAAFRLLNSKPLVTIGVLSYSLYIWQQLFLNPTSDLFFNRLPFNFLLVFAAATVSYYCIEKPFLKLRPALSKWWQSRSQDTRQDETDRPAAVVTTGNLV